MQNSNNNGKKLEAVRKLYARNPVAKAAFDHFSICQRNRRETSVNRLLSVLWNHGHDVSYAEVRDFLRELASLKCGRSVTIRSSGSSVGSSDDGSTCHWKSFLGDAWSCATAFCAGHDKAMAITIAAIRRSADENIPIQVRRASECIPSPRRKCMHSLARRACIGRATGRFPPADRLRADGK